MSEKQPTVLHLFCGAGGGALGFQQAGFRSVGNIDYDAGAVADIEYLTGEKATQADLGTLSPQELADICGERPDVVFTSPPCKGYSGCLAGARADNEHYQALNSLAFRGIWVALEAWETPPPLIMLENVPRIQSRGKAWLSQIEALLRSYGYALHRSTHDCGVLGGLAQKRQRFLLVARHMEQVPEYLRVPTPQKHKAVGDVLAELPVPTPGNDAGGDMHRLPRQSALNWLRLAAIKAGGDWRDLPESIALAPRASRQNGGFGVNQWDAPAHSVVAEGSVRNTWSSVADPRVPSASRRGTYGVLDWTQPAKTITGNTRPINAPFCVADPRSPSARDATYVPEPPRVEAHHGVDFDNKRPTHLVITAEDGTWHRPMTTLELAVLQGFPAKLRGKWLRFTGNSHKAWRQRVGNAVPPPTAKAIATNCAATLAASAAGSMILSSEAIWVAPRPEASTGMEATQ